MRKIFILIIALLIIGLPTFGQTKVNSSQIRDGLRPSDLGVLSNFQLTFDKPSKKYSLDVTSDVALTLASSGNISESYIFIYANGDGSHVVSFPSDWKIKSGVYNPAGKQRIFIEYVEIPEAQVIVTIEELKPIVIATLNTAQITGGTDDLNLTFSSAVNIPTSGWSLTASGGAVTVTGVSNSGTATPIFTTSRNITAGETMTISYDPSTGATTSLTGTEIALISAQIVDTGEGDIPTNAIYVDDDAADDIATGSISDPFKTGGAATNVATAGQTILFRTGTYRETIVGKEEIIYKNYPGETAIISGNNVVPGPWTSHDLTGGKSIYKTTIQLPVDNTAGYNSSINNSNTTLFNNQIFKGSTMQFEARYPNITTEADLLDFTKMRHYSQITAFNTTQIIDSGIPATGLTGAKLVVHGWFRNRPRIVSSQPSQSTLNFSPSIESDIENGVPVNKYRHYYYVCGKLTLLDAAKEWHYDAATNTLYLWQTGGGSPTGIEYKARNWGFDLRGKDNVTIQGLTFIGCEVASGSPTTDNCLVDNVRATYTNHDVYYDDTFPGYGNATQTGLMLLGHDNVIKNSEFQYTAGHGLWVGTGGRIENNWYRDCGYDGSWGAPFSFSGRHSGLSSTSSWEDADNVKILHNTVSRTGRSAIDMSPSYTGGGVHQNLNIEVGYNDISMWGMINVDLGAIYSWGFRDLTGTVYHHNWFHDDGVVADPTGAALHGGQYATYQDQASGPVIHHHNVFYNNWTGLPTNAGDIYNQPNFEHRNAGPSYFYNNTLASASAPYSYKVSVNSPKDVWRNNIIIEKLNPNWGPAAPLNEQYNIFDDEITGSVTSTPGTGSKKNQDFTTNFFIGTGTGGLFYRPHASSTSTIRDQGVVIPGYTDDDDSSPDLGAYKYGAEWAAPGYSAAAVDDDIYLQDNNLVFTTFAPSATVQSGTDYKGGTSSFFAAPAVGDKVTVVFDGSGFELFAEQFNHSGIISVTVDGNVQDCDSGTGGTQNCDLYINDDAKNSTSIIEVTGLDDEVQHTAIFEVTGKNASSSNYFFVYDAIRVIP